jgi:hypothetical protein
MATMKKPMKKAQDGYTASDKEEIRRAPKKQVILRTKNTAYYPYTKDQIRQEIAQRKINKKNADADSIERKKRLESIDVEKMGGKVSKKMQMGGSLKTPTADQKGLKKLPTPVRNKMGFKKNGGAMSKKK